MEMKRPIMLWITSRSRSSLVSSMFINHGVWWGNTRVKQEWADPNGELTSYISYENQDIKKLLFEYKTSHWKKVHLTPVFAVPKFLEKLANIVPANETWIMKTGVEYFNAFQGLDPYNIYITRKPEDVARSLCEKRTGTNYQEAVDVAVWRFNYMQQLQKQFGGVFVNTDNLVQDDFSEVQEAIEYCGLTYDEAAAKGAIR